jgi:hypothetical protein
MALKDYEDMKKLVREIIRSRGATFNGRKI